MLVAKALKADFEHRGVHLTAEQQQRALELTVSIEGLGMRFGEDTVLMNDHLRQVISRSGCPLRASVDWYCPGSWKGLLM